MIILTGKADSYAQFENTSGFREILERAAKKENEEKDH